MAAEQNAPVDVAAEAPAEAPEVAAPEAVAEAPEVPAEAPAAVVDAPAEPAAPIKYYYVQGSDGPEKIRMSEGAVGQSKTIADLVGSLDCENIENTVIPFNNISGAILTKIVEWCEHHQGEPIPVEDESVPKQVEIPQWDQDFLKISDDEMFDLVIAVNYLDIRALLVYACKTIALMAKGKSPEELRVIFEIPTDEEDEKEEREKAEKEAAAAAAAGGEGPSTLST